MYVISETCSWRVVLNFTLVWDGRIPEHEPDKPLIALRSKQEHTRRRRPWTRAFSSAALKGYEELINNRCTQLVEVLGNQVGAVDMAKWVSFFTYAQFLLIQNGTYFWHQI